MASEKDDIRLRSAQDVLDRHHGKATQRTENTTNVVNLTLSLADVTTNSAPPQ